jgi:hypothetical protein
VITFRINKNYQYDHEISTDLLKELDFCGFLYGAGIIFKHYLDYYLHEKEMHVPVAPVIITCLFLISYLFELNEVIV